MGRSNITRVEESGNILFTLSIAFLVTFLILHSIAVSAMVSLAKQCAFEEPSVETITGENVLTWPHVVSPLVV